MFSHYSSFIPLVLALFIWGTFVTLCVTVTNIYSWFGLIFQISILMRFRRTMIFALCLIWYFKSLFFWGFDTNKTGILLYFCQEINIFFFYYETSVLSSVLTKCLHDDIQRWYFWRPTVNCQIKTLTAWFMCYFNSNKQPPLHGQQSLKVYHIASVYLYLLVNFHSRILENSSVINFRAVLNTW